jgi:hypothetical protein
MPKSGPVASIVGGLLAGLMDTRVAIAAAGLLLPATPLLLPTAGPGPARRTEGSRQLRLTIHLPTAGRWTGASTAATPASAPGR